MKLSNCALASLIAAALATAAPPPLPSTPAAVEEIVYARPFTLHEGYDFEWRKEKPHVTQGYILVLEVNPNLVYPRQSLEPVLYVGEQIAERVNVGYRSGHAIVIVPGEIDLEKAPIWFGTPELPERCDGETVERERSKAKDAGIKPIAQTDVAAALARGGNLLQVEDRYELRRFIAGLIEKFSPAESDLAQSLLVPRSR